MNRADPPLTPAEPGQAPLLTRARLHAMVWARPMTVVARELGLTGNGLSKICDRVLVPYPARGYWSRARAGRADAPSPLPPAPEGVGEAIVISAQRAASRRPRTRVSADVRREQLMGAAAEIIASDGLAEVTMKAVARRVGISEAMAHNYFPQRRDLLLAIARRELHAMETHRRRALMRGHNRQARVMLSTVTYLQQVAERGALVQILTQSSEIRSALRAERDVTRRWDGDQTSKELEDRYGVPRELAQAATTVLTAVSLRAGRLLAGGKLSLQAAQDLTLAITGAGNRAVFGGELARGGP